MEAIKEFRGETKWLSNFFGGKVQYEGLTYRTVEAAFQSAKCINKTDRIPFTSMSAPEAKDAGQKVKLRSDWEMIKEQVMYDIVLYKFVFNMDSRKKLLDTGESHLEEGNHHGDKIWGTVNGIGQNLLGKVLMRVRSVIQGNPDKVILPLCIYHSADFDGVCSAAICHHFLNGCELYGFNYGDKIEFSKFVNCFNVKRPVYMCDISLELNSMNHLNTEFNLVWLDHHATAINEIGKQLDISGKRDVGVSGCELTWKWFSEEEMLISVNMLGDYDVYRSFGTEDWYNNIAPLQLGLRCIPDIYNPSNPIWTEIISKDCKTIIDQSVERGKIVDSFVKQQNVTTAKRGAFEAVLRGNRCIVINSALHGSQILESVFDPERHDIMVVFSFDKEMFWRYSLYSNNTLINCGDIAKSFSDKGGGHCGAAGFELDEFIF